MTAKLSHEVRMDYQPSALDDARYAVWGTRQNRWHVIVRVDGDDDDYLRSIRSLCGKSVSIVRGDVRKTMLTAEAVEPDDLCKCCRFRTENWSNYDR